MKIGYAIYGLIFLMLFIFSLPACSKGEKKIEGKMTNENINLNNEKIEKIEEKKELLGKENDKKNENLKEVNEEKTKEKADIIINSMYTIKDSFISYRIDNIYLEAVTLYSAKKYNESFMKLLEIEELIKKNGGEINIPRKLLAEEIKDYKDRLIPRFEALKKSASTIENPGLLKTLEMIFRKAELAYTRNQMEACEAYISIVEDEIVKNGKLFDIEESLYRVSDKMMVLNSEMEKVYNDPINKETIYLAMNNKDLSKINEVKLKIVNALGEQAGLPEEQNRYYKNKVDDEKYTINDVKKYFDTLIEQNSEAFSEIGLITRGLKPGESEPTEYLRTGVKYIRHALSIAKYKPEHKEIYEEYAKKGLEGLMKVQALNGVFPFPDMRGLSPRFGPMIEKVLQKDPSALIDGWIVKDIKGDGGLQFDNGLCSALMSDAYLYFGDRKYLGSAIKSAKWANEHELVTNFNYNSFSALALAKLYGATNEDEYLEGCIDKLKYGVFSGQMQNGRWFDAHNAKTVYHIIMMRAASETYKVIPNEHPYKISLRDHLERGLLVLISEINSEGANNQEENLEMLLNYIEIFGHDIEVDSAINILINSVMEEDRYGKDDFKPSILGPYVLYRYLSVYDKL